MEMSWVVFLQTRAEKCLKKFYRKRSELTETFYTFFVYILENSVAVTSWLSRGPQDNWWMIINYSFNEYCLEFS